MSTSSAPDQASVVVAPEALPSGSSGTVGAATVMHQQQQQQQMVMCCSSGSGMEAASQLHASLHRRRPTSAMGWGRMAARIPMLSSALLPSLHLQPADCDRLELHGSLPGAGGNNTRLAIRLSEDSGRSVTASKRLDLLLFWVRLFCLRKYFWAWLATCVGVRVVTKCREMPRQSPFPSFSRPARNIRCSSSVHGTPASLITQVLQKNTKIPEVSNRCTDRSRRNYSLVETC